MNSVELAPAAIEAFHPIPTGDQQYPLQFIEQRGAIRLRETPVEVTVGLTNHTDSALVETLRSFHRKAVRFVRIDRTDLAAYLARFSARSFGASPAKANARGTTALDRLADDAPIVNYVNSLFLNAIRRRASDIHIERFSGEAVVRYRIDGGLRTVDRIPPEHFPEISSRIKVMANLNIMERRLPQDGRVTLQIEGFRLDVRVSIVPIAHGESLVLRLFNREDCALGLDELGFCPEHVATLRRWAGLPHGLIVVSGPTGSGKSTTLNSMLRAMQQERRKIVTIEDPIEYVIDGVDQIQTDERIGLTFGALLRRVLRQDPDVIMVGEIRDEETAELAARAALTGHLVVTTLHTNDAAGVVTRVRNMGIPPYLTAAVLRGVLAQRLVRRVCDVCATDVTYALVPRQIRGLESIRERRWRRGNGCGHCDGTGYYGRIAVGELVQIDAELASLMQDGAGESAIRSALSRRDIPDLPTAALISAARGLTSPEDAAALEAS